MWISEKSDILNIPLVIDYKKYNVYEGKEREDIFNLLFKSNDKIADISSQIIKFIKNEVVIKPRNQRDPKYLLDPKNEKLVVTVNETHSDTREILSLSHFVYLYFMNLHKRKTYDVFILPWISDALSSILTVINKRPISTEEIKTEILIYLLIFYLKKLYKRNISLEEVASSIGSLSYKMSYSIFLKIDNILEKMKDISNSNNFVDLLAENLYTSTRNLFSFIVKYGNDGICAFDEPSYFVAIIVLDHFFNLLQLKRYIKDKTVHNIINYFSNYIVM